MTCKLTGPASHQGTFFNENSIVETDGRIMGHIVKRSWGETKAKLARDGAQWIVFHWVSPVLTHSARARIQCDLMEAMEFERYSALELPLQALDAVLNRWILRRQRRGYDARVFRKLGNIWENGVICSKTSNRALIRNGLLPSELEYGSPSDTYRWMMQCDRAVVLDHSEGWFDYPGAKKDELFAAAALRRYGAMPA